LAYFTDPDTGAHRTLAMQDCPIQLGDTGFNPGRAKVSLPRSTTTWTMAEGSVSHDITDGSGLHLFDSGQRDPPASYAHAFWAAGTYPVIDQGTGSTMTVRVSPRARPRTGSISTTFHINWAMHRSYGNRVFDVQILRPGSTQWQDWNTGGQSGKGVFTPDAGPGTYSFRARLRDISTGDATGYSPLVSIIVS